MMKSAICYKAPQVSKVNHQIASSVQSFSTSFTLGAYPKTINLFISQNKPHRLTSPRTFTVNTLICCTKLSISQPSPTPFAPTDEATEKLLNTTTNIFETLKSENTVDTQVSNRNELQVLKWPMWVIGPTLLLATGMGPTLWLPISSIFLGPNIASLLSLIGLDCIFNLGATLFLLMADSIARPKNLNQACFSKAPVSYRFWNMVGNLAGFIVPLVVFYISQKQFLATTQMPVITFLVLLGPYFLLLSVQMLTEMLTWHWKSPVWLVTPVIYEAYRVLQLMRGLKLGVEVNAPVWMVHTIRGLVCWWLLILGVQLMRVAWFAGFTARAGKQDATYKQ